MYLAEYEGEIKGAFQVPVKTDAYCPECDERVRVWRVAEDGTARHFKHVKNMGGGGGGNGESGCGGPAESDDHQKWKNFAAERLAEVFDNTAEVAVEKKLYAPHTDKDHRMADAAVMFDSRDEQLGSGLAVEVQHKNGSKDIESTTLDYVKQDVSVAWTYEEDYNSDGCPMAEVDFREMARDAISIRDVTPLYRGKFRFSSHHVCRKLHIVRNAPEELNRSDCDHTLTPWSKEVPATLPAAYFDEEARRLWEEQPWRKLFERRGLDPDMRGYVHGHDTERLLRDARWVDDAESELPKPKLPTPIIDTVRYQDSDWDALFSEYPERHYRLQTAIPRVAASTPDRFELPEMWEDSIRYRTSDWDALFATTPDRPEPTPLTFGAVLPLRVAVQITTILDDDCLPSPPNTPFDDVQCYKCGCYVHAPSAGRRCSCGTPYHWSWNVSTGRVSPDSLPDHVGPLGQQSTSD